MSFAVQVLINGILLGGVYGVSASPFSLEWGIVSIINLAHGAVMLVAAYAALTLFARTGIDPLILFLPIGISLYAAGYCLQRYVLNRVMAYGYFVTLLFTFGLDLAVTNVLLLVYGANYQTLNVSYASSVVTWLGLVAPYTGVLAVFMLVAATVALALFLRRTKTGRAINAIGIDVEGARLLGINVDATYARCMGIAFLLTGLAGILYGLNNPFTPASVDTLTLNAFIVTVLGGLGTAYGPLIGGLALGVVESGVTVVTGANYTQIIALGILVVILVLRPTGLAGRREAS